MRLHVDEGRANRAEAVGHAHMRQRRLAGAQETGNRCHVEIAIWPGEQLSPQGPEGPYLAAATAALLLAAELQPPGRLCRLL